MMPAHKALPLQDSLEEPIGLHFRDAAEWIEARRKENLNVLVHCHAGVSRSATIVIAYLMVHKGWTPLEALTHVRNRRDRARPNPNFWDHLLQFHQRLAEGGDSKTPEYSRKNEDPRSTVPSK
jgi:protein-tyrosine phosphatase